MVGAALLALVLVVLIAVESLAVGARRRWTTAAGEEPHTEVFLSIPLTGNPVVSGSRPLPKRVEMNAGMADFSATLGVVKIAKLNSDATTTASDRAGVS